MQQPSIINDKLVVVQGTLDDTVVQRRDIQRVLPLRTIGLDKKELALRL